MAVGYIRQSSGLIISGSTILASHSNNEYNALESSMHAVTGHTHDGTTGGGSPVSLTNSIVGVLPIANGGTAGATQVAARTGLGLVIGTDVQAYDDGLLSIAGLTTAADKMIYTTASDTYAVTTLTPFARTFLDDSTQADVQTTLGVKPAVDVAVYSTHLEDLTALSAVASADIFMVSTGVGAWAYETTTQVRTTLGLVISTDVQAENDHLTDLSSMGVVGAADNFMVSTAAGAWTFGSPAQSRTALALVIGTDVQAHDNFLDEISVLSGASGADQVMISTGANTWALEGGAALKTSLGLTIGTDIQAELAVPSVAEAQAGTANTERVWTAARVGQAIAALETVDTSLASGTVLLFHQASAPTGWTKDTASGLDNAALRIVTSTMWVSGKAGATAFSSVFGAGKDTENYTLQVADTPSHTHIGLDVDVAGPGGGSDLVNSAGGSAVTLDAETGSTGGDGPHKHAMTMNIHYINMIKATKN